MTLLYICFGIILWAWLLLVIRWIKLSLSFRRHMKEAEAEPDSEEEED